MRERSSALGDQRDPPWYKHYERKGRPTKRLNRKGEEVTTLHKVSRICEWFRRGGGSAILPEGEIAETGELARRARVAGKFIILFISANSLTTCISTGAASTLMDTNEGTGENREMVWRAFEHFVLYMTAESDEESGKWKQQLLDLDRILFEPVAGDVQPADWVPEIKLPLQLAESFVMVLLADATEVFRPEASKHIDDPPVRGRSMRASTVSTMVASLAAKDAIMSPVSLFIFRQMAIKVTELFCSLTGSEIVVCIPRRPRPHLRGAECISERGAEG